MKRLLFLCLTLLAIAAPVRATDVSIAATTINGFSPANVGTDVSVTVTATNGSPTVTSSAAFRSNWVGLGGFRVVIGGTTYTVAYVTSTSSLTLTGNFSGSTGSAVATFYKWVEMRIYSDRSFQPLGASYMVQPGTPGSSAFYKRFAASIVNVAGVDTLYIPAITIDATTDAAANNTARYTVGFYNNGTLIQYYNCNGAQQLAIPPATPTSWTDICSYNAAPAFVVDQSSYTKPQIDARFPSCSSGQMLYFAATGQKISCLTVGSNLSISNGTISATGGGGGGGSGTVNSGTINYLAYYAATGTAVSQLALGSTLTISGGTLSTTGIRSAVNALDYGADPTGVSNSTTAISNWITACQASGARVCYLPGGTYLTDPITLSLNGLRIVGDGREKSILKARVANNPVIAITGANYFVNVTIDGIGFVGQGKTSGSSGHCVSISDSSGGSAQFSIINSSFSACGGKGLYIPYMFAGRFANNIFDEIGDNHMEIQGGSATIIEGNDFKTLEASKVALWVYSGNPVVTGNNGIEPDSGSGSIWGRFGRSSADGDGADSYVLGASFIGNNVEDFKATGWQFRTGSGGSTYAGNTFISPSSGTVTALYFQFLSGTELGIWSGGTFTLQGTAAWTNSQPVHSRGYAPFYVSGTNTPANFYEWNAAETRTLPYMRPKLLAGTTKNGLQVSEAILDAVYDSNLAGTLTGTTDPSGNASRVLLQNGSASRPVFGSSVDSTTGAYFGTNTIGFTVGGTSRATLTNSAFLPTVKATFSPTASVAGVNVGSVSGDPSAPANGDLWYDSTGNLLRARINGSTVSLGAGGGGSPGGSSGNLQWNNSSSFDGVTGSTVTSSGYLTLAPLASSSGSPVLLTMTGPTHTGLAADTEANDVRWNFSRSVQFTAGGSSFPTQRVVRIQAPTYTMTSADTITQAITLGLNTVTAGTNATITESIGIQIAPSANAHIGLDVNHQASASGDLLRLGLGGTYIFRVAPVSGDLNYIFADSALATSATDGFVYLPSMAGVPSGAPTGYTGTVPVAVDTTNNRLYGYAGGAWRNLTGSGSGGITVGTTTVTSGTAGRVFYETAGNVMGQISGFTSDGTNVTAGSENLRATSPRVTTGINDSNGNELFLFTATGSAVNELTIANAATGSGPSIAASGSDSNINISLTPKGTGGVILPNGTASAPSLRGSISNTGIYFSSGYPAITESGTVAFYVFSGNTVVYNNSLQLSSSGDVGVTRSGTNTMRLTTGTAIGNEGKLLIGRAADAVTGNLTVIPSSATTNALVDVARLAANSTGTAATGFGGTLSFGAQTSTTANTTAGSLNWWWATATHASRTSQIAFKTVLNAGGETEVWGIVGAQNYGAVEYDNGNKSGSFTIDWNSGNNQKLTATGNLSTITFSNIEAGAQYVLTISQDATGGRTWTPPTTFKMPGGVAGNVLTGTANAKDVFVCISADGTNLYCNGLYDVKNP